MFAEGAYAISPVSERAASAQHLQLSSGCPPAAYWLASFTWDMCTHLIVALLSLAIFAAYGDQATIGSLDQVHGRDFGQVYRCRVEGPSTEYSDGRILLYEPELLRTVWEYSLGGYDHCKFGFHSSCNE